MSASDASRALSRPDLPRPSIQEMTECAPTRGMAGRLKGDHDSMRLRQIPVRWPLSRRKGGNYFSPPIILPMFLAICLRM